MRLLTPIEAVSRSWPTLAWCEGGDKAWRDYYPHDELSCSAFYSFYRVKKFSGINMKMNDDKYFSEFLLQFYRERAGVDVELDSIHKTWFFGIPNKLSTYQSFVKYRTPLSLYDAGKLAQAVDWAKLMFKDMRGSKVIDDPAVVLSLMNKSASPGFPWTTGYGNIKPCHTKRKFIEENKEFIYQYYYRYSQDLKDVNYVPTQFYTTSPKPEMLKKSKIDANKFRTFIAASFFNTMKGVSLFYDMCQKFYASNSWSFVGKSLFGGDWNSMYMRLKSKDNGVYAGECDQTAFDSTLSPQLIHAFFDVLWDMYDESEKTLELYTQFCNFEKEMINGICVCPNGDFFIKTQGNPSGCFLTIVCNTICLFLLFAYAWIDLAPEDLCNYRSLLSNVEAALCGDDSLFTTTAAVAPWFNVRSITEVWKKYGIIAKVEAMSEGVLEERHFISMWFVKVADVMLPRPDYDKTISSMLRHSRAHHGPRWSLLKAFALIILSYWNDQVRYVLQTYVTWLEKNYAAELRSECTHKGMDMFSYEDVQTVRKTDATIIQLYMSTESVDRNKLSDLKISVFESCNFQSFTHAGSEEEFIEEGETTEA